MTGTTITAQPGTPFIEITREFAASPSAVFRAYTEPDLLKQWLGPRDLEMEVLEFDARSGGGYRYVHRADRGEFRFRGVFHSVDEGERIIQTFEYEGSPGDVCLETTTFTDLGDGRTRIDARSVWPSVEARDAMVADGMERGIIEGFEQLDELLAKEG
jgi:uncharacterized protein YndB with AHSA1/START domain